MRLTQDTVFPYKLPEGFLDGPAPALRKSKLNFVRAGLPEYSAAYAVLLDGVMTEEECNQLIAAAEGMTNGHWERALINIGGGQQAMYEDTRKCGRIIWDNPELMANVWARQTWVMTGLNERARFLKYTGGEYFKAHCDGMYETPLGTERSYFTMHLYLNDSVDKDGQVLLDGGATSFYSWDMQKSIYIEPKCGRVLLFQQQGLLHSGDDVISGTKYTMRTDIMYGLEGGLGDGPEGG
ncbi:hypothetical protein BU23DRAFT_649497 [Bimuria novae-zelandiae CBS 107.79]|uniref:Prolyl 4-hydroxylase alpha subunit domain-containing protein n=1 Tax=Bimuria novae-zelandiae CBS 107.79 TaxID=1447943 RepID=A0A6A5V083_9PLEO|nr:hypothetical protein BU23DRAFT_649497 [Bimuria novae-zelandiae CBS 107.79]